VVGAQGVGAGQQQGDVVGLGYGHQLPYRGGAQGVEVEVRVGQYLAEPGHAALHVAVGALDEAVGVQPEEAVLGEFDLRGLEGHAAQAQRGPGRRFGEVDVSVGGDDDGGRMAGAGHGAASGDGVVDGVEAGRAEEGRHVLVGRPASGLLLAQAEHQVVEVGEEFVGRHLHVGQGLAERRGPGARPAGDAPRRTELRARGLPGGGGTGRGLVDQCEELAGVPPLGDVEDHVADAGDGVVGVHQREERRGVGASAVRIGPAPARVLVVGHRGPGRQDLAHQPFEGLGLQAGQQLAQPAPEPLFTGYAAEAFEGVVEPYVAQVEVHDRHADRRAGQESVEDGLAHRPLPALFPRREEKALVAADVEGRGDPQVDLDGAAVAVPQGDDAAPPHAGAAPPGDPEGAYGITGHGQQGCGGAADDVRRRAAQEFLCAPGPAEHGAVRGDHRCRVGGRVQEIACGGGRGRFGIFSRRIHGIPSSTRPCSC
jgi:hypothetical protein